MHICVETVAIAYHLQTACALPWSKACLAINASCHLA